MVKLATICYVDNGREFLLLHRNKKVGDVHQGKWIGVGGKLEAGETPQACCKREVLEETGLVVDPQLIGIITFPEFTPDNDWYTYVFRARSFQRDLLEDCPEGTLAWVPYGQVLDKPTWVGDRIFLQWILDNKPFFSAKFTYKDQELLDYSVDFYEGGNYANL